VDPLIGRVNQLIAGHIEHAQATALVAIRAAENAMLRIIETAAARVEELNALFFADLNATLDQAFANVETLIDTTLCKSMPDGKVHVSLGAFFRGDDEVTVKSPRGTHCYREFLESGDDPMRATFKRWQFYRGELCEYEVRLNRIEPRQRGGIGEIVAAYDRLAELANSARCVAPTPSAKVEMVRRLYIYQSRAQFFRSFQRGGL
jgi:hypothetical protein